VHKKVLSIFGFGHFVDFFASHVGRLHVMTHVSRSKLAHTFPKANSN